jgi:type II secretory pathway component PulK
MRSIKEKGSALLMATWILLIMGIIAAFLIYRSEAEWASVLNVERKLQIRRAAELTLNRYLAEFLADDNEADSPEDPWYHETGRIETEEAGRQITVLIEDEGSKPNLNLLNESGLFEFLPKDLEEPIPVTPVLDWIDSDQDSRGAEGAEMDYYQSLDPPYKPRDGFFSSLQELLAVKNGKDLFPYLAPEVTVYGRINFNILTKEQFINVLLSSGFDPKYDNVQEMADELFGAGRPKKLHFDDFDALFANIPSGLLSIKDRLKPLFVYTGVCNVNFVGRAGLRAIFRAAGLDPQRVKGIIERRNDESYKPFTNVEEIASYTRTDLQKTKDYFTTVSSILRYRIWVKQAGRRCYLETIQERLPGEDRIKWKAHTLAWRITTDPEEIPEIPEIPVDPEDETAKEEETEDGG